MFAKKPKVIQIINIRSFISRDVHFHCFKELDKLIRNSYYSKFKNDKMLHFLTPSEVEKFKKSFY